jgi:hypothetical protein
MAIQEVRSTCGLGHDYQMLRFLNPVLTIHISVEGSL